MTIDDPENKIRQLMRESVPASTKVIDFAAARRKLGRPAPPPPKAPETIAVAVNSIAGGNNFIGNTGSVNVRISHASRSPLRSPIPTGPEYITPQQKAALTALKSEWMALHAQIKQTPLSHGAAWLLINNSASVNSYHAIRLEQYKSTVAFIQKQMAILRSMKSAPAKDVDWRKQRITAIKARSKNQLGNPDAYKPYIKKNFKADSLTDLSSAELQRTYSYIMAKKKIH